MAATSFDMNLAQMSIRELQDRQKIFVKERDWEQFHTPKNLVMALSGEVGELTEVFQWLTEEQSRSVIDDPKKMKQTEEEIADIFLYLIRLADQLEIDIIEAASGKIKKNEEKYPVEKSYGSAKKYTEL